MTAASRYEEKERIERMRTFSFVDLSQVYLLLNQRKELCDVMANPYTPDGELDFDVSLEYLEHLNANIRRILLL